MARIRSIKPDIFSDEELWDAEMESGLPLFRAFVGLWCQADREGRFEWRPRRLKAAVLPYWDGDFSRVLDALATRGFLVRYASQGREIGLVRTFKRHQVINNREAASELPPPPDELSVSQIVPDPSTRAARVEHASSTREVRAQAEGKGREGKGKEGSTRARAREPDPPRSDASPGPGYADQLRAASQVYAEATGQTDCTEPWSPAQRQGLAKLHAWCGGDVARLRDELSRLRATDAWLSGKRVGQWADHLGTAAGHSAGMARPATPEELAAVQDDFDRLGGDGGGQCRP